MSATVKSHRSGSTFHCKTARCALIFGEETFFGMRLLFLFPEQIAIRIMQAVTISGSLVRSNTAFADEAQDLSIGQVEWAVLGVREIISGSISEGIFSGSSFIYLISRALWPITSAALPEQGSCRYHSCLGTTILLDPTTY